MKIGSVWYALLALLAVYGYWLSTQLSSRVVAARPLALRARCLFHEHPLAPGFTKRIEL